MNKSYLNTQKIPPFKSTRPLVTTSTKCTYFLFRFRLSKPPIESKSEASRVAGFLEARNADIRRYFAEVDI